MIIAIRIHPILLGKTCSVMMQCKVILYIATLHFSKFLLMYYKEAAFASMTKPKSVISCLHMHRYIKLCISSCRFQTKSNRHDFAKASIYSQRSHSLSAFRYKFSGLATFDLLLIINIKKFSTFQLN